MKPVLDMPNPSRLEDWRCLAPGAFAARPFSSAQCQDLLAQIVAGKAFSSVPREQPNSMHNYGMVVNNPELSAQLACLPDTWLATVIPTLFPHLPGGRFGDQHAFMVFYGEDAERELALHVDASHITLNICLENDAQGGEINFTGARCARHVNEPPDRITVSHRFEPGDVLLHVGNQRHHVSPLRGGRRRNLLVWYRLETEVFDHSNSWVQSICATCSA
jgi:hypothetical protein